MPERLPMIVAAVVTLKHAGLTDFRQFCGRSGRLAGHASCDSHIGSPQFQRM